MSNDIRRPRGRPKKNTILQAFSPDNLSMEEDNNTKEENDEVVQDENQTKQNDIEEEEIISFKIKKKKKKPDEQQMKKTEEKKEKKKDDKNRIKVENEKQNINKTFQEILHQAQKDSSFLIMLRNILSSGSKQLIDKKTLIKKKWIQLRNSNCTMADYTKKEKELKKSEEEDIKEIKEDIIAKLCYANIKGFETTEMMTDRFKSNFFGNSSLNINEEEIMNLDFYLEDEDYENYKSDQYTLLDKLLKENNLVSQEFLSADFLRDMKLAREQSNFLPKDQQNPDDKNLNLESIKNELNDNKHSEADKLLANIEIEDKNITKITLCKYFQQNDHDSEELQKSLLNRVFEDWNKFTDVEQGDYCLLKKRIKSLLLDIKSDELFTDAKFQKEQYDKYAKLLKKINTESEFNAQYVTDNVIQDLVEISAYIMNNVHYYQKFKLNCDLLHPLDLLYVVEKFLKQIQYNNNQNKQFIY